MWRMVGVTLVVIGLVSCNGDGGSSAGPDAPIIGNLRAVPNRSLVPNTTLTYTFIVNFFDANGDVSGGTCTLTAPQRSRTLPLQFSAGAVQTATAGTVGCSVSGIFEGVGALPVSFVLTDRAGHVSNSLSISVQVERRAGS